MKISAINEAKPHCGGSQEEIYQDHADVEAVWRVPSALGRDDMTSIVDDVAMMQNIVDNVPSKIPDSPLDALIDGLYNEQESAQSFQEALAAWRGTAVTVNTAATASEGSFTTEVAAAPKTTSQTLMDGAYDEQESARSFQEALAAWRGTTVPGATKKSATISAKTATTHEVMFDKQQPLSLKEGVYDEEESARSFQDALTPWRKGSAAVESKRNCGVSAAATNSFETPTTATASAPFNIVFNGGQSSTLSYLDRLMLEDLRRRKRDAEQVGQM